MRSQSEPTWDALPQATATPNVGVPVYSQSQNTEFVIPQLTLAKCSSHLASIYVYHIPPDKRAPLSVSRAVAIRSEMHLSTNRISGPIGAGTYTSAASLLPANDHPSTFSYTLNWDPFLREHVSKRLSGESWLTSQLAMHAD